MDRKRFVYYSVLRPVGIGTYPKGGLVEFGNYDTRIFVPAIGRMAWGWLEYDRQLTDKEKSQYDLVSLDT